MDTQTEVLFEQIPGKQGEIGLITLNRPQVLNSLSHNMLIAMLKRLQDWNDKKHIKAIVIKAAEGRAFSAGGNLRLIFERSKAKDPELCKYFQDEYELNKTIFHYPKPYIAFLDGITMGGGVGISIHGSHRIATERLLFAMPETGIGFYPDVGGTYFLPRLPDNIGIYLGLTGQRLNSDECVQLGIAQTKVSSHALPDLLQNLVDTPFNFDQVDLVNEMINQYKVAPLGNGFIEQFGSLKEAFSATSLEGIMQALEKSDHSMAKASLSSLATKSPTSLKVTLRALMYGKEHHFDQCISQELILTAHFLQSHDFFEGIRALIIDKDNQPHWQPKDLSLVTEEMVDSYFTANVGRPIAHECN